MVKYCFILIFLAKTVAATDFDLSEMQEINSRLNRSVDSPQIDCIECEHDLGLSENSHQVRFDSKNQEIKTSYQGGSKPHIINLVRTKNSPDRVKLTIHYYQRYCAKSLKQVDIRSGRFGVRCLVHMSHEREETIRINFENAPSLGPDHKETYQIKLSKERDQKNIEHQISLKQGPKENIKIKEKKSFLGLFGQRYYVE